MKSLRILPEVVEDVAAAARWYDQKAGAGLGDRFIATFESYAAHVQLQGEMYRVIHAGFRRIFLRPFPYAMYYRFHGDLLVIVLVVHGARDPEGVRALLLDRSL